MISDIEDKFLRMKEENFSLKKQVNESNNNIKLLTTRLNRLLEMSKRSMVNEKNNKKVVSLEESIFNLQLKIGQLESENRKLRQRSLVLQTKLDVTRRRQYRSMYSSVPSRTDSGLEWINDTNSTHSNQQYISSPKPSSARLTVHHRSSSTISLNRVTFNSHRNSADQTIGRIASGNQIKSLDGDSLTRSLTTTGSKSANRKRNNSDHHNLRDSLIDNDEDHHHHNHHHHHLKGNGLGGKHDFILQLLKETQDEIGRLQEIIILQQHYIDSLQVDLNSNGKSTMSDLIKVPNQMVSETHSNGPAIESTQITMEKSLSAEVNDESLIVDDKEISSGSVSDDYQKMLQVFKLSDCGDKFNLGSFSSATTKGIPSEIIRHVEKLSTELIESQNVIKSLRSQLIKDNFAAAKIVEMNQKLDHLTQENEILQKSLQNCIGTCISGLEKEETDDGTLGERISSGGESANCQTDSKRIKFLQEKIKHLTAENVRQVQAIEEKNQLINLLQVKYNNLKDAYDLIISSSRSPINKSSPSISSPKQLAGKSKFTFTNQHDYDKLIAGENDKQSDSRIRSTIKSNQDQKDSILDSLGQVREMVNSVQNELESGLNLND